MRQVLLAAVAVIACSMLGAPAANADWKDGILGASYFRSEAERAQNKSVRSSRSDRSERPVRTARATITDEDQAPRTQRRSALVLRGSTLARPLPPDGSRVSAADFRHPRAC